jgi:hypothetical protein
MTKELTVNITEVTIGVGKTKSIKLNVNGKDISIPVDEAVNAYFYAQFWRENPTPLQKKRFATLMNVLRAAYLKGVSDGKKS